MLNRVLRSIAPQAPSIDDISHVIANLLKHEYGNHPLLAVFMSACGKASQKLKQTILACLAPPKVSTKARFMNLHSDLIESLFGVAKRPGTDETETKDANRIAARLPVLCGQVTGEDAQRVFDISVAQQKEVMGSLFSLTRQR